MPKISRYVSAPLHTIKKILTNDAINIGRAGTPTGVNPAIIAAKATCIAALSKQFTESFRICSSSGPLMMSRNV
ncbi:hypothetical protein CCP1ISM_180001 [Azospirillaceae bacterium]